MDLKPENNFIDLTRAARAKRLHAMAKVEEHDKTMVDFKTSHPDDYVVNPDFWALKKESYKLRDAYYEAKERVLDRIFYTSSLIFDNIYIYSSFELRGIEIEESQKKHQLVN